MHKRMVEHPIQVAQGHMLPISGNERFLFQDIEWEGGKSKEANLGEDSVKYGCMPSSTTNSDFKGEMQSKVMC